jgi:LytS/YehU family sensor histidine kinase
MSGMTVLFGIIVTFFFYRYQSRDDFDWLVLARFFIGTILFLAIQFALKTQYRISRLQLDKEQVQTENYKAQLKVLQAQINPHFLFNALNTLRSMVRHQDANSEQFVMSLAEFYRHALNHYQDSTIQLTEEVDVLKSYLFLMKSRNENAVLVDIEIDEHLYEHHLPTMALQIVVENCFKHNSMSSKKPLAIDISSTNDLYIEVCNNLQPRIDEVKSSGHGIEILRKKYELLKIHDGLLIEKTPGEFCVKLKLI